MLQRLPVEILATTLEFRDSLASLLTDLPEPLRAHRITRAMAFILHAGADRERARANGRETLHFAVALGDLLDGMVGFLEAPVSAESAAALARTNPAHIDEFAFP
jgi:hypothetical protein